MRIAFALIAVAVSTVAMGCSPAATTPDATPPSPAPSAESSAPPIATTQGFLGELETAQHGTWTPVPGFETLQPAQGPHGDQVTIRLNDVANAALNANAASWPEGSVIVKDIYQGGSLVQLAAMKKTDKGWYWGEWSSTGEPVVEGLTAEPCEGCHKDGTDGTLGVNLE